jgi:hypothetical protein
LGGLLLRQLPIVIEIEGSPDEFLAEVQLVVLHCLDMDAGEPFALELNRRPPDAAAGMVPSFPPADNAEHERFAALDGHGRDEIVEGLIPAVCLREEPGEGNEQGDL